MNVAHTLIRNVQLSIENVEARIATLESKLGLNGVDDMYLADKINYHLGRLSGLREALFTLTAAAQADDAANPEG